jgi:hypothetical protein
VVQSQPRQIVCKTLSQKHLTHTNKRAGGVAQGEGSEFKSPYCIKEKPQRSKELQKNLDIFTYLINICKYPKHTAIN